MENGIDLTHYYRVLRKRWKLIGAILLFFTSIGIVDSLTRENCYRAEALILPLGDKGGGGGLAMFASQMIGAPFPNMAGGSDASTKLITLLESRSLSERMVNRLDLKKVFYRDLWDEKTKSWKVDSENQPTTESAADNLKGMIQVERVEDKGALLIAVE